MPSATFRASAFRASASLITVALALTILTGCRTVTGSAAGSGTAAGSTTRTTVPNVIGKRLSDAERTLRAAGLKKLSPVDDTGRGRVVIDPSNWVVDAQSPGAGASIAAGSTETLRVRRPTDATGTPKSKLGTVPNVVCMNLQDAQNDMQAAGFFNLGSADGAGQGRMQVLDRDWLVIKQSVRAGRKPGLTTRIVLTAVKYGEPTGSSGCTS